MFYVLSWFIVACLLALWSLVAWGFYTVAAWMISNAGNLKADSVEILSMNLPEWLVLWIPPEILSALPSMASSLTPVVEFLLRIAPELAGVLSVTAWVVWAVGSVLLVVLGIVVSGAIAVMRRRRFTNSGQRMAAHA